MNIYWMGKFSRVPVGRQREKKNDIFEIEITIKKPSLKQYWVYELFEYPLMYSIDSFVY